jgi:O-antigen/teichoic acid export membrane protein
MSIILWGVPLIPHMAAIWIRQGLDRYIIESSHSMTEVGLFSFALNIVNIIIIIGSSFNNSFSVEIYQVLSSELKAAEKKHALYSKSKKMSVVFFVATVVVVIGCSLLVPLALPTYSKALPYFMILSIYGFVQCLYFLVVNYLFYYKKNKEIMYTTFGTSIIHLLLSLLLTKYSLFYTCVLYVFIQLLIVGTIYYRSRKVVLAKLV